MAWHLWLIVIVALIYLIIVAILFTPIWFILKGIKIIDEKENEKDEENIAKLDAIIKTLGITVSDIKEIKKANKSKAK